MKNETYQSMEASYYESEGNSPPTIQRRLYVELTHYHTGGSVIEIKIDDYLTKYKWTGTLEELIARLVKSEEVKECSVTK
jgi:hypothetical protein